MIQKSGKDQKMRYKNALHSHNLAFGRPLQQRGFSTINTHHHTIIHIHTHIQAHTHTCTHTHTHTHLHVQTHTHTHTLKAHIYSHALDSVWAERHDVYRYVLHRIM